MHKVLAFLTLTVAASGASPIEADYVWEAADESLTLRVPADPGASLEDLRGEPDVALGPFLAMVGEADARAEVTEAGLRAVSEDDGVEAIEVEGEACHRTVTRRLEVLLDFAGSLTRTDAEEFGQAYSVADGSACDLPPGGTSEMSVLPGAWRVNEPAPE